MTAQRNSILILLPAYALVSLAARTAHPQVRGLEEHEERVIELTLEEATRMALENNLDIETSRLVTLSQEEGVAQARAVYQPLLLLNLDNVDSREPATSQLTGAPTLTSTTTNYDLNWQQLLPTGGRYEVAFRNTRARTNSTFFTFNPRYDTELGALVAQPLLRDFRYSVERRQLVVARNTAAVSRHQLEGTVMSIVESVALAYWELVSALRELDVAQKSLELAQDLLRNTRIQVEVGTLAPLDALEAEAEVAVREEGVIVAEQAIEQSEDVLLRLIQDPDAAAYWEVGIRPVDEPIESMVEIDVDEAVETAFARRPELAENRTQVETSEYDLRYTRNQTLPQLDFNGSIFFSGIGGDQIVREGFGGDVVEQIPGGYPDAIDQLFGGGFRDWSLGFRFSYPLGTSVAEAAHAQAQVQYRQQLTALENQQIQVALEVRQAARQIETSQKRLEATRVARELATRRLEAEQERFAVGMSTSFLIVQAQRDLAQAEASELRALIDYNQALTQFERARGTLLDRANVTVR